jgi:hypothetical protein
MLKDIAAAQRSSPRKEEEVVRYAAVVKEIADVTIAVMEWIYIDSTWCQNPIYILVIIKTLYLCSVKEPFPQCHFGSDGQFHTVRVLYGGDYTKVCGTKVGTNEIGRGDDPGKQRRSEWVVN